MEQYFGYKKLSELLNVKISGRVSGFGGCFGGVSGFGGCFGGVCCTANVSSNTIIKNAPYLFANCEKLEVVSVGENVIFDTNNLFHNCFSLKELNLSEGLRVLGNATFAGCGFRRLFIPSGTIIEGHYSFGNSPNLHSVEFGDDCVVSGYSTFEGCSNLEIVKAGKHVEFLGENTFDNCSKFECIFGDSDIVLEY